MTREEAIDRLKNLAWLYGSVEREQNIEATYMAIKALEELPKRRKEVKRWKRKALKAEPVKHDSLVCPVCGYLYRKPNYGAKMDGGKNE